MTPRYGAVVTLTLMSVVYVASVAFNIYTVGCQLTEETQPVLMIPGVISAILLIATVGLVGEAIADRHSH